jgi:signal transduction histidine kinase/ActR/RegA family two-component response regulator
LRRFQRRRIDPIVKAKLVQSCIRFSQIVGTLVAASGCVALYGWITESEPPKAMIIGGIAIKANSAVCLMLCGVALLILADPGRQGRGLTVVARIFAAIAGAVGAITLLQHLTGWDAGIDQLLFREPPGAPATTSPGRMGLPASTSLMLVGGALLLLDVWPNRRFAPAQLMALVVAQISLLSLIGYAYDFQPLYEISHLTAIAFHTTLALGLLAVALLTARPTRGLVSIIVADDAGGEMARRLLIPAIVIPFVLGWIRTLGQRYGIIDDQFGRPLLILALIISFTALVWVNAQALSVLGRDRARVSEQREQLLVSERAAREEAERNARLKDEFLATVSHELRTPLNAILGYSQLLRQGTLDPDVADGVAVIERNARSQKQIIEDILDMSGIVSGKLALKIQAVDLVTVVENAVATVRPSADAKSIRLELSLDPAAAKIRGDPNRLQQVVWNLLNNAIKFTPRGGRVSVELQRGEHGVRIAVRDSGEGIKTDFLPLVFDKFRQADASTTRRHGGLGLGLSIVKSLVELHGGTVHAESDGIGKGATFVVDLPLVASSPPPETPETLSATPAQPKPANGLPSLAGLTVLAVDDEPDARTLVQHTLERQGARVFTAASAAEASELLDREQVDVILSDIAMPDMDGYDFVRQVRRREHARGGAIPAAALTAITRDHDRARAIYAGYQTHIAKPIEPAALVRAVAKLTGRNTEGSTTA